MNLRAHLWREGWKINDEKSMNEPANSFMFLGTHFEDTLYFNGQVILSLSSSSLPGVTNSARMVTTFTTIHLFLLLIQATPEASTEEDPLHRNSVLQMIEIWANAIGPHPEGVTACIPKPAAIKDNVLEAYVTPLDIAKWFSEVRGPLCGTSICGVNGPIPCPGCQIVSFHNYTHISRGRMTTYYWPSGQITKKNISSLNCRSGGLGSNKVEPIDCHRIPWGARKWGTDEDQVQFLPWQAHSLQPSWFLFLNSTPMPEGGWNVSRGANLTIFDGKHQLLSAFFPLRQAEARHLESRNLTHPYCPPRIQVPWCRRKGLPTNAPRGLMWACNNGVLYTALPAHFDGACLIASVELCPPLATNTSNPNTPWFAHAEARGKRSATTWSRMTYSQQVGKRFEWVTEGLFVWYVGIMRAREAIVKLAEEVEIGFNATNEALFLLNKQLQETSRMTMQNRLALDAMLLHNGGVCKYLNLSDEYCCISIPNVTILLTAQLDLIKKAAKGANAIVKVSSGWLTDLFSSFGWSFSSLAMRILAPLLTLLIPLFSCLLCV
ncbi:uncharacterized protein LOC132250844 [Alligator mississippiensis]|uniref:uncharacterized protein LOC132250844 n=1 Tax=Alligator mississippiensis TaxID=8496 RepID=UPI002877F833|nr:uncharacterized protein LOC132250844 [Alligator mississippiensis]